MMRWMFCVVFMRQVRARRYGPADGRYGTGMGASQRSLTTAVAAPTLQVWRSECSETSRSMAGDSVRKSVHCSPPSSSGPAMSSHRLSWPMRCGATSRRTPGRSRCRPSSSRSAARWARRPIATTRGGYRLRVDPDSIDAVRYERLIESARDHRANGDPLRAIDVLERAASLWSGVPYSDLGEWPPAIAEAERLEEIRKSAEEDLQAARLECGEHRAVVPDAERLVRADPLRERRWAILVTALYRSGRQADALAALRSARERLADELGIEPGAELVALESAILHQDASLDAPPEPRLTGADCPYRGLQPFGTDDAEEFFGRDADIQAALARLSGSPFLAVSGASGCGKSSLVLAGLVPALRARGDTVVVLGSGATPIARLRDALSGRGRRRRRRHRPVRGALPLRSPGRARGGVLGADRGGRRRRTASDRRRARRLPQLMRSRAEHRAAVRRGCPPRRAARSRRAPQRHRGAGPPRRPPARAGARRADPARRRGRAGRTPPRLARPRGDLAAP